jgi:hypothetical protein
MEGLQERIDAEVQAHQTFLDTDARRVALELLELAKTIDVEACAKARILDAQRRGRVIDDHWEDLPKECMSKATVQTAHRDGWCDRFNPHTLRVASHLDLSRHRLIWVSHINDWTECGTVYRIGLRALPQTRQ